VATKKRPAAKPKAAAKAAKPKAAAKAAKPKAAAKAAKPTAAAKAAKPKAAAKAAKPKAAAKAAKPARPASKPATPKPAKSKAATQKKPKPKTKTPKTKTPKTKTPKAGTPGAPAAAPADPAAVLATYQARRATFEAERKALDEQSQDAMRRYLTALFREQPGLQVALLGAFQDYDSSRLVGQAYVDVDLEYRWEKVGFEGECPKNELPSGMGQRIREELMEFWPSVQRLEGHGWFMAFRRDPTAEGGFSTEKRDFYSDD
jgi:hypothetical protein